MYPRIFEHINLLSHILLTDEKFHISGCLSQHNFNLGQSEHERDMPKVKMWCSLTHDTGPLFSDEDITASNSFLDTLEICAFSQLNNKKNGLTL
jgi:hypothetical protein